MMKSDYQLLLRYIHSVAEAHQEKLGEFGNPIRKLPSGSENPYFFHPLWCSLTLFCEPKLPDEVRLPGALALLFHDILEDTTIDLPEDLSDDVRSLVQELTVEKEEQYNFSGWEKEKLTILQKPPHIQLLKLFDKVSSVYDMAVKKERYPEWIRIVEGLIENVEAEYGVLNITLLARALTKQYRENPTYFG